MNIFTNAKAWILSHNVRNETSSISIEKYYLNKIRSISVFVERRAYASHAGEVRYIERKR